MTGMQRTPYLWWIISTVSGIVFGFLLQLWVSNRGLATLVPPISLSGSLLVLSVVLLVLGLLLRRLVHGETGTLVNPFHAVRLLAGSRAAQLLGSLSFGTGLGMLAQVFTRTVVPPSATWAPMISFTVTAAILLVIGAVVESWCRVPPSADEPDGAGREQTVQL